MYFFSFSLKCFQIAESFFLKIRSYWHIRVACHLLELLYLARYPSAVISLKLAAIIIFAQSLELPSPPPHPEPPYRSWQNHLIPVPRSYWSFTVLFFGQGKLFPTTKTCLYHFNFTFWCVSDYDKLNSKTSALFFI